MNSFLNDPFYFGEEILNILHLNAGSWFDLFMIFITTLGDEIFFILMLPLLYWCYDKKFTVKLGGIFLFSVTLNDMFKEMFQNPRPDPMGLSEGIKQLNLRYSPESPGFPSGHTQGAVTFWGPLFWLLKNRTVRIICVILVILIPYSRLYLGVHFLGDVLGGYVIGFVLLLVLIPAVLFLEKRHELIHEVILLGFLLAGPLVLCHVLPGHDIFQYMGVFSGFLIGSLIARERIAFNPRAGFLPGVIKAVIGLAVLFAIKAGLKPILPQADLAGFLRYWMMGFWITLIAPFIFSRFALLRGPGEV